MDFRNILTSRVVTATLFFAIVLLCIYLYQRSFMILDDGWTFFNDNRLYGSQIEASDLLKISVNYKTMSFIWPIILSTLFLVYRRYAVAEDETIISRAVIDNVDLSTVFCIMVFGALAFHAVIHMWVIWDAFNAPGSSQGGPDNYDLHIRRLISFSIIFSGAIAMSFFLFIRAVLQRNRTVISAIEPSSQI